MKFISFYNDLYAGLFANWKDNLYKLGIKEEDILAYKFTGQTDGYSRTTGSLFARFVTKKIDVLIKHLKIGEPFIYSDCDIYFFKDIREDFKNTLVPSFQDDSHETQNILDRPLRLNEVNNIKPARDGDVFCSGLMIFPNKKSCTTVLNAIERYNVECEYQNKDDQLWLHEAFRKFPFDCVLLNRESYPTGWWAEYKGGFTKDLISKAHAVHFNYIAGAVDKTRIMKHVGVYKT